MTPAAAYDPADARGLVHVQLGPMVSKKGLRRPANRDSGDGLIIGDGDGAMMGRQRRDQGRLFYEFRLEDRIPENHLLRRMNVFVTVALADLHKELKPHYSDIGRPSIDPELMIRMLIVGYCYGIRSERKLTQEVELHLAYRWFCRLDLDDEVPHHSTFSENRLGRFRESDLLRHIFERVVWAAMAMGLVKGEGLAVDASVLEANASRYHGKPPAELDWTDAQRQKRAVAEYLAAVEAEAAPTHSAIATDKGEDKRHRASGVVNARRLR